MNLSEILAKVVAGEQLTDAEREFLKKAKVYTQEQLDEEANTRAVRARAKAEKDRDAAKAEADRLQVELDEAKNTAKSADEKLVSENKRLDKQVKDLQEKVTGMEKADAERTREEKLSAVMQRIGFLTDDGRGHRVLSETACKLIVREAFKDLETDDLERDAAVNPVIEKIREENPQIVSSDNGFGAGSGPSRPTVRVQNNPWVKGEHFNLTRQGEITLKDPELARRLKVQAERQNKAKATTGAAA